MIFAYSSRTENRIFVFMICLIITIYALVPICSKALLPHIVQYYYPLLTKAFLAGHLNLPVQPSPEILHLSNPYDPQLNKAYRVMFDASLYNGKYYLYFGPLPLFFSIPYKLLTGKLSTDHMGILFFLTLGFAVSFYLLMKIRAKYCPQISNAQLILAGLVLGISNNAMYLIARPSVYELAIASAFCFINVGLLFLFNIFSNNFKIKDVFLFSLCVSLSVAGRPHFALLCLVMVPIVFAYLIKQAPRDNLFKLTLALFLPLLSVGAVLALYNYLRFDSIWEFGRHYQIADANRMLDSPFDPSYRNWGRGLYYYFFSGLNSNLWVNLKTTELGIIKFNNVILLPGSPYYLLGYIKSVFSTTPVALFIFALPILYFKNNNPLALPLLRFVTISLLGALAIIIYLVSIAFYAQRFITDFVPYLILFAIIIAWLLEQSSLKPLTKKLIQLVLVFTEFASMFLAFSV